MPARADLTSDPAILADLLTVRRGTAYFARQLSRISDADLDAPSLLTDWSRRHVVAHVGYNARALTRLVRWANTGVETPMYSSPQARGQEIERGASLPGRALRHLVEHAAISLDVEWRDTPPHAWARRVRTAQGREVPLAETVWMRIREVWLHAIDLDNGARMSEVPDDVLRRLLDDITGFWVRNGVATDLRLEALPRGGSWGAGPTPVRGTLAELATWASGRGTPGTVASSPAPSWI